MDGSVHLGLHAYMYMINLYLKNLQSTNSINHFTFVHSDSIITLRNMKKYLFNAYLMLYTLSMELPFSNLFLIVTDFYQM